MKTHFGFDEQRAQVRISDPMIFEINGRTCTDEAILAGNEVVIGYIVLNKLDLKIENAQLKPKHREGAVFRV